MGTVPDVSSVYNKSYDSNTSTEIVGSSRLFVASHTMSGITTLPASRSQRIGSVILGLVLVSIGVLVLPSIHKHVVTAPGAPPFFSALTLITDLTVFSLLMSLYRRNPTLNLTILAATYLFSSLIEIPYVISFPGVVLAPGSDINNQSAPWLWAYARGGTALGLIGYVVADYLPIGRAVQNRSRWLVLFIVLVAPISLVVLCTRLALAPPHSFPSLIIRITYVTFWSSGVGKIVVLLCFLATVVLIIRTCRRRGPTLLDLGLCVGALVALLGVILSIAAGQRYTVGWYASRVESVASVSVVFGILFYETNRLYTLLAGTEQRTRHMNDELEQRVVERTAALVAANRTKDRFLDNASHELKTPLTSLQGYVHLAARRLDALRMRQIAGSDTSSPQELDRVADMLSRALRQFGQLDRLIGDLLDVSRMESNHLRIQKEACDVGEIVRESVTVLEPLSTSGITLVTTGDTPFPVQADAVRIGQVLSNFVSNAVRYAPSDQALEVGFEALEGEIVRVWVRDFGPGIPESGQNSIWERSYQLADSEAQSSTEAGLGLGLYISRSIIELHDGTVGVDSASGGGSIFWFTLPLASQ